MTVSSVRDIQQNEHFDVVVIGAGINGIGVYRELALQGLSVLLVEKDDYCSKASSAPSRMIHGGLRYLENGEFDLVRKSLTERNRLLKNAPHQVRPLKTVVPLTRYFSGVVNAGLQFLGIERPTKERGAVIVKLGLWLYDFITRRNRVMPKHHFLSKKRAHGQFPLLRPEMKCAGVYYDAWIVSPERLALELIADGNKAQNRALALNYTCLEYSAVNQLQVKCLSTNDARKISAGVLINATGAWLDMVNRDLGLKSHYIQGTKGSHIIVDHKALHDQLNDSMIYYENDDNRVCIIFPYEGKVLIGSTDLPIEHPDSAVCTEAEVDYILASLSTVFPDIRIAQHQIVFKFSGVRPLGRSSALTAGKIPRSHQVLVDSQHGQKVISLIGGKWTTFRALAEEAADKALSILNQQRRVSTRNLSIGGGQTYPKTNQAQAQWVESVANEFQIPVQECRVLFYRYGTGARTLLSTLCGKKLSALSGLRDVYTEEIMYLIASENVRTIEDVVLRRTNLAIEGKLSDQVMSGVALVVARALDWSAEHLANQVTTAVQTLNAVNGCRLNLDVILDDIKKITAAP